VRPGAFPSRPVAPPMRATLPPPRSEETITSSRAFLTCSDRRPFFGASAGPLHSRQQRRTFLRGAATQLGQSGHRRDVLPVLFATPLVAAAVLRANQRLRRASAVGRVGHVQSVTLDLLLQMLAAILAHAEAVNLLRRINNERLQLATIGAGARKPRVLPPVFGRFGRKLAALEQELRAVSPQVMDRGVTLRGFCNACAQGAERGNENRDGVEHFGARRKLLGGPFAEGFGAERCESAEQARDERGLDGLA